MQNSMLLTPSSPVRSRPMGPVKSLLAAVLVGLLGSGSAVADASDWLPLAVGNSWTYAHEYYDYETSDTVYIPWTNYTAQFATLGTPQFSISVLRTEVIDDHTYFVISDMPDFWPPAPSYFIAGKKLRWAGDQLMERTADGERSLFRFGGATGVSGASGEANYPIAIQEGTPQVTRWGGVFRFDFDDDDGVGGASDSERSERYGPTLEDSSIYEIGGATFLQGFGIESCSFLRGHADVYDFKNILTAKQAVINGRTVTVREAQKEAADRASSSDASSIEWLSWGAIKQEASP